MEKIFVSAIFILAFLISSPFASAAVVMHLMSVSGSGTIRRMLARLKRKMLDRRRQLSIRLSRWESREKIFTRAIIISIQRIDRMRKSAMKSMAIA